MVERLTSAFQLKGRGFDAMPGQKPQTIYFVHGSRLANVRVDKLVNKQSDSG